MQIDFPEKLYSGYVFDLDGTLIDTMPAHYEAWKQGLRECGFTGEFSLDFFYGHGGVPTRRIIEILNERTGSTLDPDAVADHKESIYLKLLPGLPLIEPVVDFARQVAKERPVSVASGGHHDVVDAALKATGLEVLFPVVVTPEDVAPGRGKPAPDMFVLAADRMGVEPRECLVLEDAEMGEAAARAAGMDCLKIPLPHLRETTRGKLLVHQNG